MNPIGNLFLDHLKAGLPGVSQARGAEHSEACLVCLSLQNHSTGVELLVDGSFNQSFQVWWNDKLTSQIQRSWADEQEAVESAACGIAFLLILQLTAFTVIERTRKGTGFDYWLGHEDNESILEARLEVSGILKAEKDSEIKKRVREKLGQVDRSNNRLPAYIVIVEFSRPLSYVEQK